MVKNKIELFEPLTSFDAERPSPPVDLGTKVSEIVREGEQRGQRKQVRASVLIGVGVVLGCWVWGTTVSPTDQPVPVRGVAQVAAGEGAQLDEAIRALEVQIATLDEVWRDYDRTRSYAADYRDYVRRDLDHRLAAGLAANTLLHDARLEPAADRRQEKLQRVVEHFEGTEAAAEAISLIAARPL